MEAPPVGTARTAAASVYRPAPGHRHELRDPRKKRQKVAFRIAGRNELGAEIDR